MTDQGGAPATPPSPGDIRSDAVATLVRSWARATERTWSIALRWWKLPLEFGADEQRSLGTSRTTCYFRPTRADSRLGLVGVKRLPQGVVVHTNLELVVPPGAVAAAVAPGADPVEVTIVTPEDLPSGLYEIELREEGSPETQTYQLYFGRPGQAR